jgi:hypothetical protein
MSSCCLLPNSPLIFSSEPTSLTMCPCSPLSRQRSLLSCTQHQHQHSLTLVVASLIWSRQVTSRSSVGPHHSPLPVRWRDIYQWFLESLTEQNEEAGPAFQPLTLQETVELFKRGTSSSSPSGGHTSMTSLSAELDHHSATIDLESSFSRADVILHIFTQEP